MRQDRERERVTLFLFFSQINLLCRLAFISLIEFFTAEFSRWSISTSILRVIRVLRFISLVVSYSPQLKMSLNALHRSRVAAFNLCAFLLLIVFVYALIGYGAFKAADEESFAVSQFSFNTTLGSILTLFQISTSAGWDGTYEELLEDDNNAFGVFVYIWSFLFICIMIIMNLMLTIILSYYQLAMATELENSKKLSAHDLNEFNEKWRVFAVPNRPLFINKVELPALINALGRSSSLRSGFEIADENIQLLGIPAHNEHQLYYGEVLIALNKNRLKQQIRVEASKGKK